MVRKIVKTLIVLAIVNAIVAVIGRKVSQEKSSGGTTSSEFQRFVMFGGEEFNSSAIALRSGAAKVRAGGAVIDLRGAGLDPDGADLDLDVAGGGALVIVPETWRVTVDEKASMGGVETDVTSPDSLPEGAPHLKVRAAARGGGISITTKRR
jgi:hypothetical protein